RIDFQGSQIREDVDEALNQSTEAIDAINQIASLTGKTMQEVYAPRSTNGYVQRDTGVFLASANWRATDPISVKGGDNGIYEGYATANVVGVAWYDEFMSNYTPLIPPINGVAYFTVPADGFIVASYKAQAGDIQSLQVEVPSYQIKEEAIKVDVPVF